jgi:5-formyltetrahydrofolate cyclo-ligase
MRKLLRENQADSSAPAGALHRWLVPHPELRTIAGYSPLPGEVDPSSAILLHPEIRWVYPKVIGDRLTFHVCDALTAGAFGILEPSAGSPEVAVREIDAFICPGLAFDHRGGRLGRGRGFYDRALADACPDSLKIGLCHPFQIVPDTFSEPHDVHMDEVIRS